MSSDKDKQKEPLPEPIHLGKLLNAEGPPPAEAGTTGIKKITVTFPDHREILYTKALMSELSGADLQKRQAEDQANREAEQEKRTHLKKKFEEEMQYSRINRMKLLNDWRVIMRIAKIDEIRKYLTLYMQIFERDLDDKDAILQMLDRDISEAEDHYNIALTNDEFAEIKKQFEQEQTDILRMLNNITESYNKKIAKLNQDFQELKNSQIQKINEVYSHLQEAIKKAGTDVHNKFSNEMNDIKQKSDEKNRQDADGIERLNTLEKEVNLKQKKLEKKNEELKQLKVKIKQNNEDWDQKNESLKREKEKIMNSYRILKSKLIEFRNMQHEKLKKLVKNSWECETKLKNYIKLAEKILKLAEISRRLEIDKEKILPYYENSDVERDDENVVAVKLDEIKGIDPMIYEEIESLQNFWKRYNKVKLDVIAIKKQKEEVEKQNEILKNYLQQYYDGFHVNNVVMTNENPLLKIDKMNPNPKYYVVEENGAFDNTYQEGNKIVCDTKKQKVLNYVHAH